MQWSKSTGTLKKYIRRENEEDDIRDIIQGGPKLATHYFSIFSRTFRDETLKFGMRRDKSLEQLNPDYIRFESSML